MGLPCKPSGLRMSDHQIRQSKQLHSWVQRSGNLSMETEKSFCSVLQVAGSSGSFQVKHPSRPEHNMCSFSRKRVKGSEDMKLARHAGIHVTSAVCI